MKLLLVIRNLAFFGIVIILLGVVGMSVPVLADNASFHIRNPVDPDNYRSCVKCHFDWKVKSGGRANWGVAQHKGFTSKKNHQETTCGKCHSAVAIASHPTGFAPGRSLPAEFPLSGRGIMTCTTCHDIEKSGKPDLQGEESGKGFCLSCHSQSFFAGMADSGDSLMASGHISAENETHGTVDNYSLRCLTCHRDQGAVSGRTTASGNFMLISTGGASHPIGTHYLTMARYSGYRLSFALPEEIILPNGQVGCISCHKAYSKNHGEIVLKEDLCTTCHDK